MLCLWKRMKLFLHLHVSIERHLIAFVLEVYENEFLVHVVPRKIQPLPMKHIRVRTILLSW